MLFEGFVDASVTAIESRDPTTSGHSRRVATLSVELAKKVDARLRRAVRGRPLHARRSCSSSSTRASCTTSARSACASSVLVKAKKLYEEDLRDITLRFAYIKKVLEAEHAERKLRVGAGAGASADLAARFAEIDADLGGGWTRSTRRLAFVDTRQRADGAGAGRLRAAGRRSRGSSTWRPTASCGPTSSPRRSRRCRCAAGSLTEVERVEIESHVVHTTKFLQEIPWGRRYADVPRIAGRAPRISERQRLSQPDCPARTSPSSRAS